jgi:hypothetical protein
MENRESLKEKMEKSPEKVIRDKREHRTEIWIVSLETIG